MTVKHVSADAAEAEFYRAFAEGRLEAMTRVWAESDAVVCIHPARSAITGHGAVADSWKDILVESARFDISFRCTSKHEADGLAVHIGLERLTVDPGQIANLAVTNVYRRTPDGWKIILHHAAPIHEGPEPDETVH